MGKRSGSRLRGRSDAPSYACIQRLTAPASRVGTEGVVGRDLRLARGWTGDSTAGSLAGSRIRPGQDRPTLHRAVAAIGTAVRAATVPASVIGVLPPWLVRHSDPPPAPPAQRHLGTALCTAGLPLPADAFVHLVRARGTPTPVAETEDRMGDRARRCGPVNEATRATTAPHAATRGPRDRGPGTGTPGSLTCSRQRLLSQAPQPVTNLQPQNGPARHGARPDAVPSPSVRRGPSSPRQRHRWHTGRTRSRSGAGCTWSPEPELRASSRSRSVTPRRLG